MDPTRKEEGESSRLRSPAVPEVVKSEIRANDDALQETVEIARRRAELVRKLRGAWLQGNVAEESRLVGILTGLRPEE